MIRTHKREFGGRVPSGCPEKFLSRFVNPIGLLITQASEISDYLTFAVATTHEI